MIYRRIQRLQRFVQTASFIGMLCLGGAVASASTIHVYNTALLPGQESIVEFRIVPTPGVQRMMMRVLYDPAMMEAIDPDQTGRTQYDLGPIISSQALLELNYEVDQPIVDGKKGVLFGWVNPGNIRASGVFLRLLFRAKENAPAAAQTDLKLDPDPAHFEVMTQDGSVYFSVPAAVVFHAPDEPYAPGQPGDVNRDGQINIADAVYALGLSVGLGTDPTPEQVVAADIADGDGIVTVRDVTMLLQRVVGIPSA